MSTHKKSAKFEVPFGLHMWGGIVCNHPKPWSAIGNFETKLLTDDIKSIEVQKPVFITGLARGGSTLLLEILASAENTASHKYADYPFIFTPYFWNVFLNLLPRRKEQPAERAHGDRIMITSDSPEAMEEIVWMACFDDLHDPEKSALLDGNAKNEEFEKFYPEHIRKLLYVRKASRYIAKNNNNVTRLSYIRTLFPDARFIIPVRDPVTHIISLMRQHARFCHAQTGNDRGLKHMQRIGHFEFGLDRRPINCGNNEEIEQIRKAWNDGEEIRGWALYWNHIYKGVRQQIENNTELKSATKIIRYEELCDNPHAVIGDIAAHCDLPMEGEFINNWSQKVCAPQYYDVNLSDRDLAIIRETTAKTASTYGYPQ